MDAVLRVDLQPRLAVVAVDELVDAGRAVALLRAVVDARRLTAIGTVGSFSVRWAGWSSSWLVLEMNTEDSRSKVSMPSGLG